MTIQELIQDLQTRFKPTDKVGIIVYDNGDEDRILNVAAVLLCSTGGIRCAFATTEPLVELNS